MREPTPTAPHRPTYVHFADDGEEMTPCGIGIDDDSLVTNVPELVTCKMCLMWLAFDVIDTVGHHCHFCDDTGMVLDMAAEIRLPCRHCARGSKPSPSDR